MSRILSGGVSQHALGQTPPSRYTPQVGTPPAGTPPGKVHPPSRYTSLAGTPAPWQVHLPLAGTSQAGTPPEGTPAPWQVHPHGQVHSPGQVNPPTTVTAADGTHPTRILSCFKIFFVPVLHMVTQTLSCIFLKDTQISNFPTAYSMPDNFMEQNILSINNNNRHTVFVRFCYS